MIIMIIIILFYRTAEKLQYYNLWLSSFFFLSNVKPFNFYLGGNCRETLMLLFIDNNRFINDSYYKFGKMVGACCFPKCTL